MYVASKKYKKRKFNKNASLQVTVGKRFCVPFYLADYSTGKQTSVTYSFAFFVWAGLTW